MYLYLFSIFLIVLIYLQINISYGIENEIRNDEKYTKTLENYWQWWGNTPEDNPDNDPKCSMYIDTKDSFIFLQNAFETGYKNYDCTDDPIPKGYSIMFPLITSFCSQGDVGLENKPIDMISNCALNLDRGTVKGKVILDDKKVVDIVIYNSIGIDMDKNKKIINNLPQYPYYTEIFSKEFVDILVNNNTTLKNNWAKEDYIENPIYYKGIIHCDCIILQTNDISIGSHNLQYIVSAKAEPPSPNLIADRWDFTSNTNYKLIIQ
jgi:hypothetical protein